MSSAPRHVVLVVGPPGAGKSSLAADSGLLHLEREQFGSDSRFRAAVVEKCGAPDARVVVVRTCPTLGEQAEWELLSGASEVVVLSPPFKVCARRLFERGNSRWRGEVAAAEDWFVSRVSGVCRSRKGDVRVRPSAARRGYDWGHAQTRRRVARQVNAGLVMCARFGEVEGCPGLIVPGSRWHLDHTDDRSGYLGASHARCNSVAAALKSNRRGGSREW